MSGVYLPKFTTETEYDLKKILLPMGIRTAFDSNTADFSGISERDPIFIDSAIHKTFVSVDEKGTEAAAATGITGKLQSGPPNMFRADHPFVFIIQDDSNGNILFIGRVVNPLQ
jgi:serpin B